jgi:hypothetical protein
MPATMLADQVVNLFEIGRFIRSSRLFSSLHLFVIPAAT